MKAILLVRVSTEQQQLDEQTSNLISYAIQKGYSEDNLIIIEDKESAIKLSEEERNGLNLMKDYIANDSTINAVFVWELSRLFRRQKTGYSLREYFINNHIQLFCFSPNFQLLTDNRAEVDGAGSINFALFAEMADAEMRNKKARFHRSKIRNAKTAKYSGGFIKFGYYVDDNGYYQINETEAEIIRMIFNRYESGISMMKLNKELKERGISDSANFVREILIAEAFTGVSNKYKMNRVYPQIISLEQFNRCKEIAKDNNRKADKTNEIYFGKNLIKCSECGTNFIAMKSSLIYLCYGRYGKEAKFKPETACKNSPVININVLESLLWHISKDLEIKRNAENDKIELARLNQLILVNNEKIGNIEKMLSNTINEKRERNNKMYLAGQIKDEKYFQNAKDLDTEEKELINRKTVLSNEIDNSYRKIELLTNTENLFQNIADKYLYFENLDSDLEKQEIIKQHIKEINIEDEKKQTTKIIHIHLYNNLVQKYRVHINKKPVIFEKFVDSSDINDFDEFEPKTFYQIDVKYLERFIRYKKVKK